MKNRSIFALAISKQYTLNESKHNEGALAQLVEQWTENPCVPGSIPGGTTYKPIRIARWVFCFYKLPENKKTNLFKDWLL